MGENTRNSTHAHEFVAMVTVSQHAAYYATNMCQVSNVMFSTCFELSQNCCDCLLIGHLSSIN